MRINDTNLRGTNKQLLKRNGISDSKCVNHETELDSVKNELKVIKENFERCTRFRNALIQNISHEIRTPLNAITGFSALIAEPELAAEPRKEFADIISASSDQLLSIINDITEISNIESGKLKINRDEIDLNSEIKKLQKDFTLKASEKGIGIRYETSLCDSEAIILTDRDKLLQVVRNLLNNAIKYTDYGLVDFGYTQKRQEIEFYVSDMGIGIKEKHQQRVFDAFFKVNDAELQQYNGTGLGLAISSAYIELLGGKIWFRSTPGKGTDFYFTIPYNKASG